MKAEPSTATLRAPVCRALDLVCVYGKESREAKAARSKRGLAKEPTVELYQEFLFNT